MAIQFKNEIKKIKDFQFGLEAEFILTRLNNCWPLWHQNIRFEELNSILESIDTSDFKDLKNLDLEPPHKKLMPYVVEGYHITDENMKAIDIKPKGVEIRTPVMQSLSDCLLSYEQLLIRLKQALKQSELSVAALSHHPREFHFEGPQNKRRHDFWLWAMEVMTTYGPDINVSIPSELQDKIDLKDLDRKINYYAPALSALSVASPFFKEDLWKIRGRYGKSYRMFRRSPIAPPIEVHPNEEWRLEFKVFDMANSTLDFECQFLCFLGLLLTEDLTGRADNQLRIYDLGQVSRFGLQAEDVTERLKEFFDKIQKPLNSWGFNIDCLSYFYRRMETGISPADEMIEMYEKNDKDLSFILKKRSSFTLLNGDVI